MGKLTTRSEGNGMPSLMLYHTISTEGHYTQTKNEGWGVFLVHLSTTYSRGAFRVTLCLSSVVRLQHFFKQHLFLNIHCLANLAEMFLERSSLKFYIEIDFIKKSSCHDNQMEFSKNSFKIFCFETAGQILKLFHRDISWMTRFKICPPNLEPSKTLLWYLRATNTPRAWRNT